MTLRNRTLIIVGAVLTVLMLVFYLIASRFLVTRFDMVEEGKTQLNVERVSDALGNYLDRLATATGDYSTWDETYEFVKDVNAEFIAGNFSPESFATLGLNAVVCVNAAGKVVFIRTVNLESGAIVPVPAELAEHFTTNSELVRHRVADSRVTGILTMRTGPPLLMASRPILDSDGTRAIRGALVFGRYLDAVEIARFSNLTHVNVSVRRVADKDLPPDFQRAHAVLSGGRPVFMQPLDEANLAAYVLKEDVFRRPTLLMRVDVPRLIHQEASHSLNYFMMLLLSVGLVFGVLTVWLLTHFVLTPVARLSKGVASIGASGDLKQRLPAQGGDELSELASSINVMVASLELNQRALAASERRLRLAIGERKRIGQDLHDGIIQSIYAVGLSLEDCRARLSDDPVAARERLLKIRVELNDVIRNVRSFIAGAEMEAVTDEGLPAALASLQKAMAESYPQRFDLHVEPSAAASLGLRQATHLLYVAREAMSNSARHSQATVVTTRLESLNGRVILEIRDDGVGFDPDKPGAAGLGLRNLTSRAQEIGARLDISSEPGRGSCVRLDLASAPDDTRT